jgi:hypothetical protein
MGKRVLREISFIPFAAKGYGNPAGAGRSLFSTKSRDFVP